MVEVSFSLNTLKLLFFTLGLGMNSTLVNAEQGPLGYGDRDSTFFYHWPPDPVNIRTLNFFFPIEDHYSLPCFAPIEIKMAYNSYSGGSSIFGDKWTFNHNIRVNRAPGKLEIVEGDGFTNVYTKERNLEEAKSKQIEMLIVAQKKIDVQSGGIKAPTIYEELKRRLNSEERFREQLAAKLLATQPLAGPGTYYSFARGPSTVEMKPDGTFIRRFQNSSQEFFNSDGRLIRSEDRNGNSLQYAYSDGNLIRINDMCGRSVTLAYQADPTLKGLIRELTDSLNRKATYTMFPNRRLKSFTDVAGKKMEFEYDKVGNMTKMTTSIPGKAAEIITFEYNDKYEVAKQSGPGSKVSKYSRTFPGNNTSHSITEILKYEADRYTGKETHEFKLKEYERIAKYDAAGKELSRETKTFSKETGYPASILDAQGRGDKYVYDPNTGNMLKRESIPSRDVMTFDYEPRCSQVKMMALKTVAGRESSLNFVFDPRCNLIDAKEMAEGKSKMHLKLEYNKNGKLLFLRDQIKGDEIAFTYWEYGKPQSITLKDEGTIMVKYSPSGEMLKVETFAHGKAQKKYEGRPKAEMQAEVLTRVRESLDRMLSYLRPAGINIGF